MTAFASKPGFKPVKHLNGSAYTGQSTMYVVGGATTLVPGDVVTLDGTGHASGVPTVTISTATAVPCGVVVGVVNAKLDPISGKLTTGSIALDTPQTAIQGSYVMVADAPDLIMETEIATYTQALVNSNYTLVNNTFNTTTGASNMKIVAGANASTDPFKLMGLVQKMDQLNVGGSFATPVDADTNVKVLVTFNTHAYKGLTGTAGV